MQKTTVEEMVKKAIEIFWDELCPFHMPVSNTESLKQNASNFEGIWNFRHAVRHLEGKLFT